MGLPNSVFRYNGGAGGLLTHRASAWTRRLNVIGGAKRDRTADLLNAIQALSQLSYGPDRAEGGI